MYRQHTSPLVRSGRSDNRVGPSSFVRRQRSRQGAVLVEFALIAFVFYMLLAGTVEMGRMVLTSQVLNNAARVGARELALLPLPATMTFDQAMVQSVDITQIGTDPIAAAAAQVHESIFDKGRLVIDVTGLSEAQVRSVVDGLPLLNQALVPLMVREKVTIGAGTFDFLRYPGALVANPHYQTFPWFEDNPYDVLIPHVVARDAQGHETIEWLHVVEEVRPDPDDPLTGPFSIASNAPAGTRGVVALRINYPYAAATLSAYVDDQANPTINTPIEADDGAVSFTGSVSASPVAHTSDQPSMSGSYGLGKLYALGKEVRPFARLISAQSFFHRERLGR